MGSIGLLLTLLAVALAAASAVSTDETFDYFLLSHEWPFSFCSTNKCKNTNKLQPLFNIHGLWPEHVSGTCQGQFNYSELQPIMNDLLLAWMDLKNPENTPEDFWKHEYTKHGECASVDSRYNSTYLYFNAALQLHKNYTLTEMLAQAGIVPGPEPIKASKVRDALVSSFGHQPDLSCVTQDATTFLYELRLCFEKDLTPRDCTGNHQARPGVQGNDLKYIEIEAPGVLDESWSLSGPRQLRAEPCKLEVDVLLPANLEP